MQREKTVGVSFRNGSMVVAFEPQTERIYSQ